MVSFIPDSVESSIWKSSQKLLRPIRTGVFVLSSQNFQQFQNLSAFSFVVGGPFHLLSYAGIFTYSNVMAFVFQKRLFYFFENFPSILLQPDIDILVRQKKGMIFWDIWAEILLKAAEKYNVNIPSFVTLKEEQEVFVEKLVHDSKFFESFQVENGNFGGEKDLDMKNSSQTFSGFFQNFVLKNSPSKFFDPFFLSEPYFSQWVHFTQSQPKFKQSKISNLFGFSNFENFLSSSNFSQKNFFKMVPFNKSIDFSTKTIQNKRLEEKKNFSNFFPLFDNVLFQKTSLEHIEKFSKFQNISRWESNQFSTFQSQETDFFLDIHLPKSLRHVHFLKYYEPAQFTLGPLICQISSGYFSKTSFKKYISCW